MQRALTTRPGSSRRGLNTWFVTVVTGCLLSVLAACSHSYVGGYSFNYKGTSASRTDGGKIRSSVRSVEVDHRFGEVRVEGESNPSQLGWSWEVECWAMEYEDAQQFAETVRMRITEDGLTQRFELVMPPPPAKDLQGLRSSLVLRIPEESQLRVDNRHGDLVASHINGDMVSNTAHGTVRLTSIRGNIRSENAHGGFEATDLGGGIELNNSHSKLVLAKVIGPLDINQRHGSASLTGTQGQTVVRSSHSDWKFASLNDELDLELSHGDFNGHEIHGKVRAHVTHGHVRMQGRAPYLDLNCSHGNINLNLVNAKLTGMNAKVEHGDLFVSVPASSPAHAVTQVTHGGVDCALPQQLDAANSTAPVLHLSAEHGDIRVLRRATDI